MTEFGQVRRGGAQDHPGGLWSGDYVNRRMMVIAVDGDTMTVVILADDERPVGSVVRLTRLAWPLVVEE